MAQTLAMRATSLAASTALLALAGIAALAMSWTVAHLAPLPDGPVIRSETLVLETPKTPTPPIRHSPPADTSRPTEQAVEPTNPRPTSFSNDGSTGAGVDPRPPTISNPHWLQTPRDLARYYPMMAQRRDIEGEVQLDCLVTTTGALQCSVASETPANWGFGAAAIRIAQDYRMVPAMRDGAPIEARYRMRVPFRLNR